MVAVGLAAERECQCLHFDRIAERSGCAVCFHIADLARAHTGIGLCHGDHFGLAAHAGCGEAGLVAAVVIERRAFDGGVDLVVVADGVFEALQHDDAGAVAEAGALAFSIEGARAAVGAVHAAFVVHDAAVERNGERDATGQSHVAFAITQCLERLCDRHQRGAARRVDAERRTAQIELEGKACGDVVLLVGGHHREVANLLNELGMTNDVAREVGVVAHAGIHADEATELRWIVGGVLQCGPCRFQEYALLRVHQCGHFRVHTEENRIEFVSVADHTTRLHVIRIVAQLGGYARVDLVHRPCADAVLLIEQVLPQLLHILGTGETAAHADDGDVSCPLSVVSCPACGSEFCWCSRCGTAFQVCSASLDRRMLIELHNGQLQAVTFELRYGLDAQQ